MACFINSYRLIVLKKVQNQLILKKLQFTQNIAQCKHIEAFSLCMNSDSAKSSSWPGWKSTKTRLEHMVDERLLHVKNFGDNTLQHFSTTTCILMKRKPVLITDTVKSDALTKNTIVQVFDTSDKLIGKMTLGKAEELAKKDELKLVDIGKNVDKIPCFKLMTGKQLYEEEMKQKTAKKQEVAKKDKEFRIKINISDHDLEIKLNQIKVTLKKGMNVKIVVRADRRTEESEVNRLQSNLLKKITESVQELATVKKASKTTSDLMFILKANNPTET